MNEDSGRSWQKALRKMPRWLIVLVIAIAWAALQLGMRLLRGKEVEPEEVAITGAFGLVFGLFVLWGALRARAHERSLPPGSPTSPNVQKAMSTGQLPEEASAQEWEAELIWMLIQDRHTVWVAPLVFGLFTALGVFLIFDQPDHPWFGVLCTALFVGLAVGMPLWIRRRRKRIQKLLAQLPEEEPSQQ